MTGGERFTTLRQSLAPVDETARAALVAMKRRERLAVPGFLNQLGVFAVRFVPRRFAIGQLAANCRKALLAAGVTASRCPGVSACTAPATDCSGSTPAGAC